MHENHTRLLSLYRRINAASAIPVSLTVTHNRRSMISLRSTRQLKKLRLQTSFEQAPEAVLEAVFRFVALDDAAAWERVNAYVRTLSPERVAPPPPPRPRGRVFDLESELRLVRKRWFPGENGAVTVTWGSEGHPRQRARQRSIRFGSCDVAARTIRIHPRLDRDDVPRDFLHFILYHEFLHLVCPPIDNGRQIRAHHAAFLARERAYPGFQEMERIGRRLLARRGQKTAQS